MVRTAAQALSLSFVADAASFSIVVTVPPPVSSATQIILGHVSLKPELFELSGVDFLPAVDMPSV